MASTRVGAKSRLHKRTKTEYTWSTGGGAFTIKKGRRPRLSERDFGTDRNGVGPEVKYTVVA